MKMIKKYFLITGLCLIAGPVFAGGKNINNLLASWGKPAMTTCLKHNIGNACIGNSMTDNGKKGTCKNWNGTGKNQSNRGTSDDEMATLLLLARDVNANGAYFCVTQVQGANKNKDDAWTTYYNPSGGMTKCMWLCKSGFYGEGCKSTAVSSCDSTPVKRADFEKYSIATSGSNIEGSIPMFFMNVKNGCGLNKTQEHDMVLAISGWTESGHGAFAQPVIVRAERDGWKDMVSTATVWKTTDTPVLVCKNGYQANSKGTDCEAKDTGLCALSELCSGWTKSGFNASIHKMEAIGSCYQYRCSETGFAFASVTDKKCVECKGDARVGAPDKTGVCVKCDKGKIFDENASASGYCVTAKALSVQELVYGPDKDQTAPLAGQCWLSVEPDDYKKCLKIK